MRYFEKQSAIRQSVTGQLFNDVPGGLIPNLNKIKFTGKHLGSSGNKTNIKDVTPNAARKFAETLNTILGRGRQN